MSVPSCSPACPSVFTEGSDVIGVRRIRRRAAPSRRSSIRFLKTTGDARQADRRRRRRPRHRHRHDHAVPLRLCRRQRVVGVRASTRSRLGLPLDAAATLLGPRMMGHHLAFELLVVGEPMDAARALRRGPRQPGRLGRWPWIIGPEDRRARRLAAAGGGAARQADDGRRPARRRHPHHQRGLELRRAPEIRRMPPPRSRSASRRARG